MEKDISIIWNEYHDKLHRFIQNRVKDKSLADDILQEVFIKIYSHLWAEDLRNSVNLLNN